MSEVLSSSWTVSALLRPADRPARRRCCKGSPVGGVTVVLPLVDVLRAVRKASLENLAAPSSPLSVPLGWELSGGGPGKQLASRDLLSPKSRLTAWHVVGAEPCAPGMR